MKPIASYGMVLMLLTAVGCGVEQREPSEMKYFLLDVRRPASDSPVEESVCLKTRPVRVASAFSGQSLVYRIDGVRYEQDYYNRFLSTPDNQITRILRAWLIEAGFQDCGPNDTGQYSLQEDVTEMYADFSDSPRAVIGLHVTVTGSAGPNRAQGVVLDATFSAHTPLPEEPTPSEVVENLGRSLSQTLQQVENALADTMIAGEQQDR